MYVYVYVYVFVCVYDYSFQRRTPLKLRSNAAFIILSVPFSYMPLFLSFGLSAFSCHPLTLPFVCSTL